MNCEGSSNGIPLHAAGCRPPGPRAAPSACAARRAQTPWNSVSTSLLRVGGCGGWVSGRVRGGWGRRLAGGGAQGPRPAHPSPCPAVATPLQTDLKVMREGLPPTGGVWLHTMCATGRRTASPCRANSRLCPHTSSILRGGVGGWVCRRQRREGRVSAARAGQHAHAQSRGSPHVAHTAQQPGRAHQAPPRFSAGRGVGVEIEVGLGGAALRCVW